MQKGLLLFLLILMGSVAFGQTPAEIRATLEGKSVKDNFDLANDLFYQKKYNMSKVVFEYLVEQEPENLNFNYKAGVSALLSNTKKTEALAFLIKAETGISKGWDPYNYMETKAPVDCYYYLGRALHLDYQFDEAIANFNKFKDESGKKHFLREDADVHITQCQLGKQMVANPNTRIKISNLGPTINGEYSDFSPVLSLDGNVLFFTSRRVRKDSSNIDEWNWENGAHYEDIYMSIKNTDGTWGEPKIVDFSEVDRNEATIGVNADGSELFVYVDDEGDGNIYNSEYADTSFDDLNKMGSDINTTYWETHATLTPDGNTLYFVSDRKGGFGGRDIYRVKKLPNGEWSKAQVLTSVINTPYDEDSPFISADGKTLYFSSNGRQSMGGFDIFVTRMDEDGNWSDPAHLEYPINTTDDDVFFIVTADGKTGYYSSQHEIMKSSGHGEDEGYGEKDIYRVDLETPEIVDVAVLKGFIVPKPGEPLPSNIEILVYNLTTGDLPQTIHPRKDDGGYVMALDPCNDYRVEYYINGAMHTESEFKVPCEAGYHEIHKEIPLSPISLEGDDMVYWKVLSSPSSIVGKNVAYFDAQGNMAGTVKVGEDNKFSYKNDNHDYSYKFNLMGSNNPDCDATCIALVDKDGKIKGYALDGAGCDFAYKPGVYQVLDGNGKVVSQSGLKVKYYDETGAFISETTVNCEGRFMFKPLRAKPNALFTFELDNEPLCDELDVVLLGPNGEKVSQSTRTEDCKYVFGDKIVVPEAGTKMIAEYQRFYKYNKKGVADDLARFEKFADSLAKIVELNGVAYVEIESSASHVPTTTFKTNRNLTNKRAEDAKQAIITAMKKRGIDPAKIKISSYNALVQGPPYRNDFDTNRDTYEKYQYIKLKAK
jgi:hypothetical protein